MQNTFDLSFILGYQNASILLIMTYLILSCVKMLLRILHKNLNEDETKFPSHLDHNGVMDNEIGLRIPDCRSRINSSRPKRNRRHFTDDIFKCIFMNEKFCILLRISMKFVPKGSINNIPALVKIMAWRRPGDKPLSEPIVINLLTHICVTRPQWDCTKRMQMSWRSWAFVQTNYGVVLIL